MKTVVLASGGLDSSTLMFLLKRERAEMLPVHVNYGQLAEQREWIAVRRFCAAARLPQPVKVDASGLGQVPSGLTRRGGRWNSDPFYPGRNLLLATVGAIIGYPRGYRTVALGLVANALYPDQTQEFVRTARDALSESLGCKMSVIAPLLQLPKTQVVELGLRAGAPLDRTYSCQRGSVPPCGHCSSCKDRLSALQAAAGRAARRRRVGRVRTKSEG